MVGPRTPTARRALSVFLVATAGFVISMFYRVSATVISPALSAELSLDAAQLSTLSAAFFYAFALFQLPAGPLLDRLGSRRMVSALGLVGVVGGVVFATSQGYGQALAGRALLGLGMSCNLVGAFVLLAAWFPADRFATLAGTMTSMGNVGMALAATPLAWAAVSLGWRGAFAAIAAVNAAQVVAYWLFVRDRPAGAPEPARSTGGWGARRRGLYGRPFFWAMSLSTFCRFGAFMGASALWAGPYLMQGHGLTPVAAGNVLLAGTVGMIAGLPLFGALSDRWLRTRKWVVAPGLCAMAGVFVVLAVLPAGTPPVVLGAVFLCLGLSSAPGQVMYTQIKELAPPGMAASGMTGINFFNMLGPAVMLQAGSLMAPADLSVHASPSAFAGIWWLYASGLAAAAVVYMLVVPDSRPN